MSDIAIRVDNLSKQYRLGTVGTGSLSDDLKRFWAKVRGKEDPFLQIGEVNDRTQYSNSEYVWPLKDINFEVKKGEVLGIIGKNGAGKSTLLKILSKVTGPTTGRILANGRIGSLLEVGTGFHPELTGMENIFLNGAILGMTKKEISLKLDEIIEFSGCERYTDTPVKRYSSGMKVRLGFAVAAFLEPEILIVDEVLAVGDAEFQKKAIGKMQDVSSKEGRTVLFVSHNMASVKSLCSKGLLLENGLIKYSGAVDQVINQYMSNGAELSNFWSFNGEYKNEHVELLSIRIKAVGKDGLEPIDEFDSVVIETNFIIKLDPSRYQITYLLKNDSGQDLFTFSSKRSNVELRNGTNQTSCFLEPGFLNISNYYLDIYIIRDSKESVFKMKDIAGFSVQQGKREVGSWFGREPGLIKPNIEWKLEN